MPAAKRTSQLCPLLASRDNSHVSFKTLKTTVVVGSVLASYNVEAFSLERMRSVEQKDILSRFAQFQDLAHFDADLP